MKKKHITNLLLFVACFFVTIGADAQARIERSNTPIVPEKGVFGAGIKPPVIKIDKPQRCIDSILQVCIKAKRVADSTGYELDYQYNTCSIDTNINFIERARYKKTKNYKVYALKIKLSGGAIGTSIEFSKLNVPNGAELYAYTGDRKQIVNKFNLFGNFKNIEKLKKVALPSLDSDEIIIEYIEPKRKFDKSNMPCIIINKIFYTFKNTILGSNQRDNCTIDANCDAILAKEHLSVGKIAANGNFGTGTLLNNTSNNKKLYFLTAKHVVDGILAFVPITSAYVYFNYQTTSCNSLEATNDVFYTIKEIVSSNSITDFALLELDSYPEDCQLTYEGWDTKAYFPLGGGSLHHPQGDDLLQEKMKFSNFVDSEVNLEPTSISSNIYEAYTLWLVHFYQQQVKVGSSGCSLFNEDNRVVGQLIGSSGNCDDKFASYGRFDISWDYGANSQSRLRDWLDPLGVITEMNSYANTLYPWDLQMKDSNWANCDDGTEPNFNCTHGTGGEAWDDIWESPDLWNCQGTNDCTEPEAIKSGETNRLRFTIRNPNNCTSDVPTVHLYWTVASTGEVWPEDWVHTNQPGDNCIQGNEIATLSLPTLAPNEIRTSSVNWTPPALSNFSGCSSADINDLAGSKMEMCLLARLETPSDPILREEENVPVTINILYNNNIVTRNTILEDVQRQNGQASIIHLKNNNNFAANLNLVIKGIVKVTPQEAQQLQDRHRFNTSYVGQMDKHRNTRAGNPNSRA